ncbi:hypothetical protein ACFSSB_06160 [Lacinutrix gracilariae]|uniref:DUF2158 domain-containing protein n=1 Tax=Lacinutrix gracilariae TaxID=1747198 RepID=A0ABW5K2G0_9FLAO
MPRKFKPGDWVKLKGKFAAPKMEVLKYVSKKDTLLDLVNNNSYLQCVWYTNGERNVEVFHQNKLIKCIKTGGLFKT